MKQTIFFIAFLMSLYTSAQMKIKILDEETKTPITNAKISINQEILYSNEDGIVRLPLRDKSSEISIEVPFYDKKIVKNITEENQEISLKPTYNKIEDVILTKFDFNALVKNLYENYSKFYNTKSHLYDAQYKDKLFINNKINSLLIADIDLFTTRNAVGMTLMGNVDEYLQIALDKVKYYKVDNSEINFKKFTNRRSISWFNGRMFLNGELAILQFGLNKIPVKTKIVYQDDIMKKFSFETETLARRGTTFRGNFVLDKETGAVTYMEVEQTYSKSEREYKSDNGKISINTKSVITIYDFYKKNEKYMPSKLTLIQKGIITNNEKSENFSRIREIVFTNARELPQTNLQNKIDVSKKDIISYIPDNEIKNTKDLLSKQEQEFIDEP